LLSAVAVLDAIARRIRHGFDIMDATRLPSGTVYPILGRLERDGYVRSRMGVADHRFPREAPAAPVLRGHRRRREDPRPSIEHYRTLGGRLALAAPGLPLLE
jgi:hypothetical protein